MRHGAARPGGAIMKILKRFLLSLAQ